MTIGALLAAAGSGERLSGDTPKALRTVAGAALVEHALRGLRAHPAVGPSVLAVPASHAERFVELAGSDPAVTVVAGGKTRQDSIRLSLAVLDPEVDTVLVHDAARPFVTVETIDRVLAALREGADAVVPVVAVTDTIKRVGPDGAVIGTVARDDLRAAQTPQGFRRAALTSAHQYARMAKLIDVSDDAGLVERHGGRVVVVDGDIRTFKITRPLDLRVAELIAGT